MPITETVAETRDPAGDATSHMEDAEADWLPTFAAGTQELLKHDVAPPYLDELVQVIHDFKSPLSTIALEVELLDSQIGDEGRGEVRRSLARINKNLMFVDRMLHDLLDAYASDAGALSLQRDATDLSVLVAHVVERTVSSRHRVAVSVVAEEPVRVSVDALRIERVIGNLLSNALKHAAGSEIVVRVERRDNSARVSISDHGPGMSAAESAYAFDRFRRSPAAHSREGTGLGLYASKLIVEAHGGRIAVEPAPDHGCLFYFELPSCDGQ